MHRRSCARGRAHPGTPNFQQGAAAEKLFKRMPLHRLGDVKRRWTFFIQLSFAFGVLGPATGAENELWSVGVARVDITPSYPVRLAGYAVRTNESRGVAQRIFAKALAFGRQGETPAVLLAVDNCGVPGSVRDELTMRLERGKKVAPERVAVCSTHTHSAPWLEGYLANLFAPPIATEEREHLHRYTREVVDALERVAVDALENRRPATLSLGKGTAGFAANRRTKGGPVDHQVRCLFIKGEDGVVRAVVANYACHCTTLTGEYNQICGDWAGFAQAALERQYPKAVAMVTLGCGGDANPSPRPGFELAERYGEEIAAAVRGAETGAVCRALSGALVCRAKEVALPYTNLPTRAEWERLAVQTNHIGLQARTNLARLERGERLPTELPYTIQTWTFGNGLAMVFLPGEVVVDYSLRLQREFEPTRLWINAYANDVPCYIPSERVLREGGYEGAGAMVYYDKPAPFAPGLENRIIGAVHELLPLAFARKAAIGNGGDDGKR